MIPNEVQDIEVKDKLHQLHENSVMIIFTNNVIGGSVFGVEAGMEEISFLTHPELLVLRLLAEPLEDNETLLVSNVRQFCMSQGSADSIIFASEIEELNRIDSALGGIPPEILERVKIIEGDLAGDDYAAIEFLLMVIIASKYQRLLTFFTLDNEGKREMLLKILGQQRKGRVNAAKIYKALEKYNGQELAKRYVLLLQSFHVEISRAKKKIRAKFRYLVENLRQKF